MTNRTYSPELLSRLTWETKSISDHAKLATLFQDLHKQGDIDFNPKLKKELSSEKHYFRFVRGISTIPDLCEYCLNLQMMQERGFAIITRRLNARIEFQRKLIKQKKNGNKNF